MNISSYLTSNRLVYVLIGGIAFLVLVTIILVVANLGGDQGTQDKATLQFWGVFDDETIFNDIIRSYEQANKGVDVQYTLLPYASYERELVNALAAGRGPDVFMIHHTWLPKHGDKLLPAPDKVPGEEEPFFTLSEFQKTFADVTIDDLTYNGRIYALPLYVDTLALYYNKDLLGSAGIALPPKTWREFNEAVPKLVKKDEDLNIVQAAATLGTARNVNRSTDILMMMMIQGGTQMVSDDGDEATFAQSVDGQPVGESALTYYTDFAMPTKEVYTWNGAQEYSVDAFSAGRAAMTINYSHQVPLIRAKNPRLNFAVAPVPQHVAGDSRTFASYWAPAVSKASANPVAAWRFVRYLASPQGAVPYLNASGRPAARLDLISQQQDDPDLGVFARQALTARSWLQVDNQAIETIFADMIDNVILGRQTVQQALGRAQSEVSVLMGR